MFIHTRPRINVAPVDLARAAAIEGLVCPYCNDDEQSNSKLVSYLQDIGFIDNGPVTYE